MIKEEKKITQEMDKTYHLYLDDEITSQGFGKIYKPLEKRLQQIGEQIPEIQGEIDFLKIQYLSRDEILNEAKDLYSRWNNLSTEERRKIVENITEKVIIGKDDVTINLCYLPTTSPEVAASSQRNFKDSLNRQT